MRAVWAMLVVGGLIEAAAIASGAHPALIVVFTALWLAVFVPLWIFVRRTGTQW